MAVAGRRFKAFDASEMSPSEIAQMANFLANEVDSMDPESVAYAAYAIQGAPSELEPALRTLVTKLMLVYRKHLVEWFEHALKKRANLGGGGKTIQKLEDGLAAFVAAIPDIIAANRTFRLSDYVPDNEYLDPEMMDRVAQRIIVGVRKEAQDAGVLRTASVRIAKSMPFEVKRDPSSGLWYIPPAMRTYDYREDIKQYGFRWNPTDKRWETRRMTQKIREDFTVERDPEPPAALEAAPPRFETGSGSGSSAHGSRGTSTASPASSPTTRATSSPHTR